MIIRNTEFNWSINLKQHSLYRPDGTVARLAITVLAAIMLWTPALVVFVPTLMYIGYSSVLSAFLS